MTAGEALVASVLQKDYETDAPSRNLGRLVPTCSRIGAGSIGPPQLCLRHCRRLGLERCRLSQRRSPHSTDRCSICSRDQAHSISRQSSLQSYARFAADGAQRGPHRCADCGGRRTAAERAPTAGISPGSGLPDLARRQVASGTRARNDADRARVRKLLRLLRRFDRFFHAPSGKHPRLVAKSRADR